MLNKKIKNEKKTKNSQNEDFNKEKMDIDGFIKEAIEESKKRPDLDVKKDINDIEKLKEFIRAKSLIIDVETRKRFFEQYLIYRKVIFILLIILLIIESFAIFTIIILSGIRMNSCNSTILYIDPGTLKILVGATLSQICIMIYWIIKSVFPSSLVNIMGK